MGTSVEPRFDKISGVITPAGRTLDLYVTDDGYIWVFDEARVSPVWPDDGTDNEQGQPVALDRAFDWLVYADEQIAEDQAEAELLRIESELT